MPLLVLSIYKHADVKKTIASAIYLIQIVNTISKKQLFNPRCIATLVALLCTCCSFSQYTFKTYNLVPNPSFEFNSTCNIKDQDITKAISWWSPTTDSFLYAIYLNSCATDNCCSVPISSGGLIYKYPHQGNAMTALYTWSLAKDGRTYIQSLLLDTLKKMKKYYIEFYTQNIQISRCYTNNIGVSITSNKTVVDININKSGLLPSNQQINLYSNPIIKDTQQWLKVGGVYKAMGGELFITIGNFKNDQQTNILPTQYINKSSGASYYIDDVSVIPLDSIQLQADAGRDTTITKGDSAFIGTLINGLDTVKWQVLVNGQVIDTIRPGFWVKPTVNTCYVLTQTVNGYTSSDTVCVYVNALPVRFINLTLNPSPTERDLIALKFRTANEINVSHYNIQYSPNGKDFKPTGNPIPAKGGSLNEYMVYNSPPLEGLGVVDEVVYYRIVGIDHDGQQTFSEIKSIKLNTAGVVSIYPNPAKDVINISGNGIQQINIVNSVGKTVVSTTKKQINVSTLLKGMYFIEVITSNNTSIHKFIKL